MALVLTPSASTSKMESSERVLNCPYVILQIAGEEEEIENSESCEIFVLSLHHFGP